MPIVQVNIYICEACGATESSTKETSLYDDPVVTKPSEGWDYKGNKLLCPQCMKIGS